MRGIDELTAADAQGLRLLFTDIDGTVTDESGRIPARVFTALEAARDAGLEVIPVTGRPAGWCDLIARTWPVAGVVGENGGLWFRRRQEADRGAGARMERIYAQDEETRATNRERLLAVAEAVLREVPGAALASDQAYREFDVAVDFCEDVEHLGEDAIDAIVARFEGAGCHVKVSDIHVNAWYGAFDKASMCKRVGEEGYGLDLFGADGGAAVYFGDSPNDAPLFAAFPLAVGVANVRALAHRIEHLPAYVTAGRGCDGFVEGVERLLALRG